MKTMNKKEMIKELKEIKRILEMSPEAYAEEFNKSKYITRNISAEDAWACRTGEIHAKIEWILNPRF